MKTNNTNKTNEYLQHLTATQLAETLLRSLCMALLIAYVGSLNQKIKIDHCEYFLRIKHCVQLVVILNLLKLSKHKD